MENMVINRGNPRQVSVTVLGSNGVKIELSKCTDVELILWINGRSKRASNTQILNDILIAELTASELDYLGEYSAQVKYTDNGVVSTSERVYLFRVANEFYRTSSGTGISDGKTLEISVSTPQAINKGYSAYEIAVQNGYIGTEREWIASLSQDSKDAAEIAYDAAQLALNNSQLANDAANNANSAAVSVNTAKEAAIQATASANMAANSANSSANSANTAAANANNKADLANTAANNADVAKFNAEKATADANTATLNATNAANNANAKAVYANEQGDYAKQQGLNSVETANEAATNANNAAFSASQQAAYAKQQGDYAKTEAAGIDAKIATKANQSDLVQLEQDVNLLNRRPQGLRFKAGDNTVFAKTIKALALGTDDFTVCVVARTEWSNTATNPIIGFSKDGYTNGSLKIYSSPTASVLPNGIAYALFEKPLTGSSISNSITVNKTDNTSNLHHIVITRSGTLVTCVINGRLVKTVTQDRVLDFSNFIYDIANTSYFWGGAVFNYAMTQAESNRLLWNGGRYDDIRLGAEWKKQLLRETPNINNWIPNQCDKETFTNGGITGVKFIATTQTGYVGSNSLITSAVIGDYITIKFKLFMNNEMSFEPSESSISFGGLYNIRALNNIKIDKTKVQQWQDVEIKGMLISSTSRFYANVTTVGNWYAIANVEVIRGAALLEYRPENIRSYLYLNSGIVGTDGDLVYPPTPPEIIYDKPYQDVVMLDENKAPDWHPIAMNQKVITPTNIYGAKLPNLGEEWKPTDFKLLNN